MLMIFPFSQRSKKEPWFVHQVVRSCHIELQKIVNKKGSVGMVGLVGCFLGQTAIIIYTENAFFDS